MHDAFHSTRATSRSSSVPDPPAIWISRLFELDGASIRILPSPLITPSRSSSAVRSTSCLHKSSGLDRKMCPSQTLRRYCRIPPIHMVRVSMLASAWHDCPVILVKHVLHHPLSLRRIVSLRCHASDPYVRIEMTPRGKDRIFSFRALYTAVLLRVDLYTTSY